MTDYQGEKFKEYLQKEGISVQKASETMSLKSRQSIYQYFNSSSLSREVVNKITSSFNTTEEIIWGYIKRTPKLEAKPLRLADPKGFEATTERFYTLPDDSLIMQTPVIPFKAWGSYLRGHSDPEFYTDLETIPLPVDKKHFGSYLIFEMGGESMVNITNEEMARKSLWPGQKIVGRDLSKDKWKYKLHINTTEAWIVVHRIEGIVVKSIIDHDVDNALITLHSWNPDKETYPDFTISLNDVEQIFNIVDPFNKLI